MPVGQTPFAGPGATPMRETGTVGTSVRVAVTIG